jgi:AbiEi antitoxin C-terminal domain
VALLASPDQLFMDGRPFLRRVAIAKDMPRRVLDGLLVSGLLRQPLRGVLVDARVPDSLPLRAECLALVLPPGAAVCRRTAAWLYGIDCRAPGEQHEIPLAECVVPNVFSPVRRGGVRGYEALLSPDDVCLVEGVLCTTPVRTAIDLARFLPRFMGLAVIDAMAHRGLVETVELAVRVEAWRGQRFVARARDLIALCEPRTESFGESWLRLRVVDARFPAPEAQIELPDREPTRWRLDLGYREAKLGLEYDGEEFHSSEKQREHDEQRRLDCERSYGWNVYGFTKAHVLGPRMDLELAVGELLSMTPRLSRRGW